MDAHAEFIVRIFRFSDLMSDQYSTWSSIPLGSITVLPKIFEPNLMDVFCVFFYQSVDP